MKLSRLGFSLFELYPHNSTSLPVNSIRDFQRVSVKGAASTGIPCQEQISMTKAKPSFLANNARKATFLPVNWIGAHFVSIE
jgi:hypothetical protein